MLTTLLAQSARPTPFQPSEAPFWDDPYIASQLLANHLDDSHEMASRPRESIKASVEHLVNLGLVTARTRVLDLGCGPGLVATELARAGAQVTGIDLSANSIDYARTQAAQAGHDIDYQVQDFLTLETVAEYDLALQSYGELSTFAPTVRDELLARLRRALVPGGALVFDVSTAHPNPGRNWYTAEGGLWRPGPHLVLTEQFDYPDKLLCQQHLVIDDEQSVAYRMWFQDYTPQTIQPILGQAGFSIEGQWGDLTGTPYHQGSPWLAILARSN